MAVTVTCSKVYPDCSYTATNGTDVTGVQDWLDHVDQKHEYQHRGNATGGRKDALAFS